MHVRLNKFVYLPLGGALGAGLLVSALVAPQPKLAASENCYGVCSSTSTLSLTKSAVIYGKEAVESFSVTVTGNDEGSGKPTGLVEVDAGSRPLCRFDLSNGAGHCSIGNKALPPATYSVRAFYSGNANFRASFSGIKRLEVERDSTRATLSLSRSKVTYGRESAEVFHASVSPVTAGLGYATGVVDVYTGDRVLCHFSLSRGAGHCSLGNRQLGTGGYQIEAHYRGNADLSPTVAPSRHLAVVR
jgi:hypothetical protein